jgi:prepilin-type N-terminal cleavage/methylation domain-containing protein
MFSAMPCLFKDAPMHNRPGRGFTLIELMVVIAIIGLLTAIVVPGAQSLSRSAATTVERSAARSMIGAWRSWSFDHAGRVLPGPIPDIARRRWLWRLVPYLDDPVASLWVNDQRTFWENTLANSTNQSDAVYLATLHPSLGMNTDWLGGRQSNACDVWTLEQFIASQDPGASPLRADTIASIRRPADLVAFASARGRRGGDASADVLEGYWRLNTPFAPSGQGATPQWETTDTGNFVVPKAGTNPESVGGFLSPRHSGRVLVAAPDGHVGLESFEALGSMRRWADPATEPQWVTKRGGFESQVL